MVKVSPYQLCEIIRSAGFSRKIIYMCIQGTLFLKNDYMRERTVFLSEGYIQTSLIA
jgi:hypothetical protein